MVQVQQMQCGAYGFNFSIKGSRELSQWYIAGEKFIANASTSIYVSIHLTVICENVQPLVCGVPGVHCFQSQMPNCVCSYFSPYYCLLQVLVAFKQNQPYIDIRTDLSTLTLLLERILNFATNFMRLFNAMATLPKFPLTANCNPLYVEWK